MSDSLPAVTVATLASECTPLARQLARHPVVHVSHTGEQSIQDVITSPGKTKYAADHVSAAQVQLLKAATRLAELLNAIEWK